MRRMSQESKNSWVCSILCFFCLMYGIAANTLGTKMFCYVLAAVSAGMAKRESIAVVKTERMNDLLDDLSVQAAIAAQFKQTFTPFGQEPEPTAPKKIIPLFDWDDFEKNRNQYPHLILVGASGSGKSTLGEWLIEKLGGWTIAVAPHYDLGDYPTADLIIGVGSNYGEDARPYQVIEKPRSVQTIGEPELSMNEIVSRPNLPTVCQFLNALLREMKYRYQIDPNTGRRRGGELVNVILDEIPAYAALPGVKDVLKKLIREARKVNIRLVLMAQGSEVETLGIAGEGSLRQSLTFIQLGDFALQYARTLSTQRNLSKDDKEAYQHLLTELEADERPCMVKAQRAIVPDLSDWRDSFDAQPPEPEPEPSGNTSTAQTPNSDDGEGVKAERSEAPPVDECVDSSAETIADEPTDEPIDVEVETEQYIPLLKAYLESQDRALSQVAEYILAKCIALKSKGKEWVKARDIQNGTFTRLFPDTKATHIRDIFNYLAAGGYGSIDGEGSSLKFRVSN